MRKQLFFVSLLTLTACGQNTQQHSDTSALVSETQAIQAFGIVKEIDYLPFTFIMDGCYARSLYMSLELAAKGIPSSAHYVEGYLQPTETVTWSYHVAPLLQLKDSTQEPWILDPAFEEKPLSRTEWLKKNYASSKFSLSAQAGNATTYIRAGSAYFDRGPRVSEFETEEVRAFTTVKDSFGTVVSLKANPIDLAVLISDFNEMPTFLSSDIHSACTVMYNYIGRERFDSDVTSDTAEKKRARLLESTTRLAKAVYSQKKLSRNGIYDSWSTVGKKCATAMAGYYL